jgi:hypothetical protein
MSAEEASVGFVRFEGALVEDGYLDARKSAQALLGLDEAVRFFVFQEAPSLRVENLELPVRVKKGSWEIVLGGIVLAYGVKAAQKMAEKDFSNVGMKDVLKRALKAIQWVIRIGKHLGDVTSKRFERVQFRDGNREIGILNSRGEILFVPKEYLKLYAASKPTILKALSELV